MLITLDPFFRHTKMLRQQLHVLVFGEFSNNYILLSSFFVQSICIVASRFETFHVVSSVQLICRHGTVAYNQWCTHVTLFDE